jgi:hypothetical protein
MASTTCPNVSTSEHVVPEQLVPDQTEFPPSIEKVNEPDFMITSEASNVNSVLDQPSETNIQTDTSTNVPQPSNLAIQPCASAKTNVPSPSILFLDSTILAYLCENIFQELNKLIQGRNNLIHKDSYEKL